MVKKSDASPHNFAIGSDGELLPHTPDEIRALVAEGIEQGALLLVVFQVNNDLRAQVFGPPSRETARMLQHIATTYAKALGPEPFRG